MRHAEDRGHGERERAGPQAPGASRSALRRGAVGKPREATPQGVAHRGAGCRAGPSSSAARARPKCASGRWGSRASRSGSRLLRASALALLSRSCPRATWARAERLRGCSTLRSMRRRRISAKRARGVLVVPCRSAFRYAAQSASKLLPRGAGMPRTSMTFSGRAASAGTDSSARRTAASARLTRPLTLALGHVRHAQLVEEAREHLVLLAQCGVPRSCP